MVQTTNPKGAAKVVVGSIIPWLQVRVLPVLFRRKLNRNHTLDYLATLASAVFSKAQNGSYYRFAKMEESHRAQNERAPAYRLHKASGQAIVTINRQDHYLIRG